MLFQVAKLVYYSVQGACSFVVDTTSSVLSAQASSLVLTEEQDDGIEGRVVRIGINTVCHVIMWRLVYWYILGAWSAPLTLFRWAIVLV